MKYISLIIYFHILSFLYAYPIKPKLCVDCKFFRKNFLQDNKYGKCTLFPKKDDNDKYFLVDGIKINDKTEYFYCCIARDNDNMCGIEGKHYTKK